MGFDLFFDSQPEPLLPPAVFDELVEKGQATASVILQELRRMAQVKDDPRAREVLGRVEELACTLAADPLSISREERWVRVVLRNWRYTVVEGHLLALAWLATGRRFIPVVQATEPELAGLPSQERAGPAAGGAVPPGPPAGEQQPRRSEALPAEEDMKREVLELPVHSLSLRARPGTPLPQRVFEGLARDISPASALLQLNRLVIQGAPEAQEVMDKVGELKDRLARGEAIPPVSCVREDGAVVVAEGELTCLAAAMAGGGYTIPVHFVEALSPAPEKIQPDVKMVPGSDIARELQERIDAFRREARSLTVVERAERLAALEHYVAEALGRVETHGILREALGMGGPLEIPHMPSQKEREKAARKFLLRATGLPRSTYYWLLKVNDLPPAVRSAGEKLSLLCFVQLFRLKAPALQEAAAAAVAGGGLSCRQAQKLVNYLLDGFPLKEALDLVCGANKGAGKAVRALLQQTLSGAHQLLEMLQKQGGQEAACRQVAAAVENLQEALTTLNGGSEKGHSKG